MSLLTLSLALSAILFALGVFGVLVRRNAIILFMCIELMLNAVNLAFITFSRMNGIEGQVFVFFVMAVAASEAAVGLALVISIFRFAETVDTRDLNILRW